MVPHTTIQLDRERTWRASARNISELFRALGGRQKTIDRINALSVEGPDGTRIHNANLDEGEMLDVFAAVIWSGIALEPDCPPLADITALVTFAQLHELITQVMPLFNEAMTGRPTPAAELEAAVPAAT